MRCRVVCALREVMLSLALHQKEFGQAEEQLHALIQLKPDELRYRQQLAGLPAARTGASTAI